MIIIMMCMRVALREAMRCFVRYDGILIYTRKGVAGFTARSSFSRVDDTKKKTYYCMFAELVKLANACGLLLLCATRMLHVFLSGA